MNFVLLKKKRYKFHVDLQIEELTAVTFLNGVLFAKIRLLEGGRFCQNSSREEVNHHVVKWGTSFSFVCKMSANVSTGILQTCRLRISVRKELKGGRSFLKLGFVDLNLAELAGSGSISRRCLLEGYKSRYRQDNSMIKVNMAVTLLSGDPCFKVPSPRLGSSLTPVEIPGEDRMITLNDNASFTNLPSILKEFTDKSSSFSEAESQAASTSSSNSSSSSSSSAAQGHKRHLSMVSCCDSSFSGSSNVSGYGSLSSPSLSSLYSIGYRRELGHNRKPSDGSVSSDSAMVDRASGNQFQLFQSKQESRFDATRVNPDKLINDLINSTDFGSDQNTECTGLQLYMISSDTRHFPRASRH